jgi:hypothetical protein
MARHHTSANEPVTQWHMTAACCDELCVVVGILMSTEYYPGPHLTSQQLLVPAGAVPAGHDDCHTLCIKLQTDTYNITKGLSFGLSFHIFTPRH